jgi:hypothetical protein
MQKCRYAGVGFVNCGFFARLAILELIAKGLHSEIRLILFW